MNVELGTLIAILGTTAGIWFGYSSKQRASKDDVKSDASDHIELKTNVEYIRRGVDDIRLDFKAQERTVKDLSDRVIRVEESAKQAHKRLDLERSN